MCSTTRCTMSSTTGPKLLLIDGMNIVRRIYEAVKGDDTPERADGALRSSWGSIMRGLREHQPTHALAAFDAGGRTWRHELYANYKVDRKSMAEPLRAAIPGFLERLNNAGIRTLRMPGVEADDTLTTLATKAAARGFEVVVLSTDKDMLVLLEQGIKVYDHFSGEFRDEAWVRNKYGIRPAQMTDFLALCGDDVDGIPGVEQIGAKTAAKLLLEHRDLDTILAKAASIKGKLGERLRDCSADALLSRQLASMKCDLELGITPRDIALPRSLQEQIAKAPDPTYVRTTPTGEQVMPAAAATASTSSDRKPEQRRLRM